MRGRLPARVRAPAVLGDRGNHRGRPAHVVQQSGRLTAMGGRQPDLADNVVGQQPHDFGGAAVRPGRRNADGPGSHGHQFRGQELHDPQPGAPTASLSIALSLGLAIGMAARTAPDTHTTSCSKRAISAALEERERLSRQVHDGVIQVLALVAKRGHEIGGATSGLADLASEQERALRRWLSSTTIDHDGDKAIDLGSLLRRRESDRVSMSMPGTAVTLERRVAAELDAAVGNALDNVRSHAGPDARAFVLLEDLGDSVAVSIRDDGVGIPAGIREDIGATCRGLSMPTTAGKRRWAAPHNCVPASAKAPNGSSACRVKMANMPERALPTVMVVDDHPFWREAIARDLADDGFDVVATADGVAASAMSSGGQARCRSRDGHAARGRHVRRRHD